MNEHVLVGCRTEPLGSYLKALGVLRLVGEQADHNARGFWRGDTFVLRTTLDRDELLAFFLDEYRPAPIVSPWNAGSGFKGDGAAKAALETIYKHSSDVRLATYRTAIDEARDVVTHALASGWRSTSAKEFWDKRYKAEVVQLCRSKFPDEALAWIDATVVLAIAKEVFPPLLGTGGNDGRLDFSDAFMQRIGDVLCLRDEGAPRRATSLKWLHAAFFATAAPLMAKKVGQFDPGGAGGPNSDPLGAAESLVNPWDWVLIIEGSMLFASSSARRLDAQAFGRAAVPFTVDAAAVGFGSSATGESSRGEIWAPIWDGPSTVDEITRLIGEGRAEWRGRQAKSGLDIGRAAAALGVDRGIGRFVRYALLERNGLATAAVPVGVIEVRARPAVNLLGSLDPWLDRVRHGKNGPAAVPAGLRRVESALYEVATVGDPLRLQRVLISIAELEATIGRATRFRDDAHILPVNGLDAGQWVPQLDDGRREFRLAAALASQRDDDCADLRQLLRPILRNGRAVEWSPGGTPVGGFGRVPLVNVLADVLAKRSIDASRAGPREVGIVGVQTAFRHRIAAPLAAVVSFVAGELDDQWIERLLAALLLLDWRAKIDVATWYECPEPVGLVDPAFTLLAPFFHGRALTSTNGNEIRLIPEQSWPAQLAHDQTATALASALRRLRQARLPVAIPDSAVPTMTATSSSGHRLAAALLCPISTASASRVLNRTVLQPID